MHARHDNGRSLRYPATVRKKPPIDAEPARADPDDAALFREAIGADRGKVRALPDAPLPPAAPKPKPSANAS